MVHGKHTTQTQLITPQSMWFCETFKLQIQKSSDNVVKGGYATKIRLRIRTHTYCPMTPDSHPDSGQLKDKCCSYTTEHKRSVC